MACPDADGAYQVLVPELQKRKKDSAHKKFVKLNAMKVAPLFVGCVLVRGLRQHDVLINNCSREQRNSIFLLHSGVAVGRGSFYRSTVTSS
jgi:hypothetical protein